MEDTTAAEKVAVIYTRLNLLKPKWKEKSLF
jgi:hypothetical protein